MKKLGLLLLLFPLTGCNGMFTRDGHRYNLGKNRVLTIITTGTEFIENDYNEVYYTEYNSQNGLCDLIVENKYEKDTVFTKVYKYYGISYCVSYTEVEK